MKQIAIIAALALAGCTTTSAGLAEKDAKATLSSNLPAKDWAQCASENLPGASSVRGGDGRYWVVIDSFGTAFHRWDFKQNRAGSTAQFRSAGMAGGGRKAVAKCAT